MNITSLLAAATATQPSGLAQIANFLFMPLAILLIFWVLVFRPQSQRVKQHQAQINAVKKGDRVVTGGGLIGKITKVTDTEVEVELGQGVRVTAVKSTLSQVIDPTTAKPAND